ncbi:MULTISPECIES: LuxR C-terminal-related transcriptional regulator [unclassified Ornithinimicrobium]|uniref:helix-turn-helix transcriptional regulator n=1 Tax=unclassified Ornithinimicrobium TaxID=2615080 RepID=UPI003852DAF1
MTTGISVDPFSTVVEVIESVATSEGTAAMRLSAAVDSLVRAVSAPLGMLVHGGPGDREVHSVFLRSATPVRPPPRTAGEPDEVDEPDLLLDALRAGSEAVTTAARHYGAEAWEASERRADYLLTWGVDQLLLLPVRSGPRFLAFVLGRAGEDFSDEDLIVLHAVRPVVRDVSRILQPGPHLVLGLPADVDDRRPLVDPAVHLTGRERTILHLLSMGHTAVRIGHLADCSPRTVQHHLANIYAKLGVGDRLSAVNRARELGLVDEDGLLV